MSTPVSQIIRSANYWGFLGDSRIAEAWNDGSTLSIRKSCSNVFNWGNALSGNRVITAYQGGLSGDRSDQMLARLTALINSGAGVCYCRIGTNDLGQALAGYTTVNTIGPNQNTAVTISNVAAVAWANIQYAAQACALYGIKFVYCLETGSGGVGASGGFTVAQIGQLLQLNELARRYAKSTPGFVIFDMPFYLWNPTNNSSVIAFQTNFMRDSNPATHEDTLGGYAGGIGLAPLIQSLCPPLPREQRNIVENNTNAAWKFMPNPLFSVGSGGTLGAGATGTVVSGFTALRNGGGGTQSVVCSVGAAPAGGNEQILACTFAAAGDKIILIPTTAISPSNWGSGDVLFGGCEIAVDSGATNLAGTSMVLTTNFDSTTRVFSDMEPQATSVGPPGGYTISLETERVTLPTIVSATSTSAHIEITGSGAGSATVRVRRWNFDRERFV